MSDLKEVDLDLDKFQNQKLLSSEMGYAQKILNLLFLRPGDIPSLPDAYINFPKLCRWKDIDVVTGDSTKEFITTKIRKYLPEIPLEDLTIYSVNYKGQPVVILDFKLTTNKVISVGMVKKDQDLINFKIESIG